MKKAFVRYSTSGKIVPGSLILTTGSCPSGPSLWKEVPIDLCCDTTNPCPTPDYQGWKVVTGGTAGDGVVLPDATDTFTIVGPNDADSNGWTYITKYFPEETCLEINYQYMAFDDIEHDYPVFWTSPTEPTGIPGDLTPQVTSNPEEGTWTNIHIPAENWFAVGIYSDDSCCGRGFLSVEINTVPCPPSSIMYFANYSTTSGPKACYQADDQFNIYTGAPIALSVEVFTDGALTIPTSDGWYSVSGATYHVVSGVVTAMGTCPATSAFSYVISGTDLAAATGNTDVSKNGKVYATTTDDGSGTAASRTFSSPGSYNHWLCSADPITPTFGYYASNVLVTVGLVSTQTNIGAC